MTGLDYLGSLVFMVNLTLLPSVSVLNPATQYVTDKLSFSALFLCSCTNLYNILNNKKVREDY